MPKVYRILTCLVVISLFLFVKIPGVQAADCDISITPRSLSPDFKDRITITSQGDCFAPSWEYVIVAYPPGSSWGSSNDYVVSFQKPDPSNPQKKITPLIDLTSIGTGNISAGNKHPGTWNINVCKTPKTTPASACKSADNILAVGRFEVGATPTSTPTPTPTPQPGIPIIDVSAQSRCRFPVGVPVTINRITNVFAGQEYKWWWHGDISTKPLPVDGLIFDAFASTLTLTIPANETSTAGPRKFCINKTYQINSFPDNCITFSFENSQPQGDTSCNPATNGPVLPNGGSGGGATGPKTSSGGIRCDTSNGNKIDNGDGIMTAIGCISTDPETLIQGLFRVGIGLGGAAALLLMIGGAFQFITSAGNPDAIKSATETFTQAIIGLLVIIFAVLLLQVIGVDILDIPGFGK